MKSFDDDFRPYQYWMANKVKQLKGSLIALDMSMGKTAIILSVIRDSLYLDFRHVLIVSPKKVAVNTWPDEVKEWEEAAGMKVVPIIGTPAQRIAAVKTRAHIHTVNRENLKWLYNYWGKDWPYDFVVWDDSGGLKAWKHRTPSKSLTIFGTMAKIRPKLRKYVALTGTPAPNGIYDLGGQMFIVDGGERLGRSRKAFEDRWFDKDYMGWDIEPKPHAFREITDRCRDVMFALKADDYIDLPSKTIKPIYVDLPKKAMAEYRKFERTLVSETYDVEAVTQGVLTNKLLQFANGSMYQQDEGEKHRRTIFIHDAKLDALDRIIDDSMGANVLLAYQFKFDVKEILRAYPKAVIEDDEPDFIKLWNKKKIRLGIVHAAAVGHGTNLQFGGHIQAWYGLTWNLEQWLQFNKRLDRPGQEADHVSIYPILARGTMDETAYSSLQEKNTTQDRINKAVAAKIRADAGHVERKDYANA